MTTDVKALDRRGWADRMWPDKNDRTFQFLEEQRATSIHRTRADACTNCLVYERHIRCQDRLHCGCCGVSSPMFEVKQLRKDRPRARMGAPLRGPGRVDEARGTHGKCRTCGEEKPLADWPIHKKKNGDKYYRPDCRDCYRGYLRNHARERQGTKQ